MESAAHHGIFRGAGYSHEGTSFTPPKLKAAVVAGVKWLSGITGYFLAVWPFVLQKCKVKVCLGGMTTKKFG